MSPLTKALVIVVTILAVSLVGVTVPTIAKYEDLQSQLTSARAELTAARTQSDNKDSLLANAQNEIVSLQTAAQTRIEGLQDDLQRSESTNTTLSAQVTRAQSEVSATLARFAGIEAALDQQSELLAVQTRDLTATQGELTQANQRVGELTGRLSELQIELSDAGRTIAFLQEQLVIQAQANQNANPATAQSAQAAPSDLTGSVTQIAETGGQTAVQFDLGANDGLEPGMQLAVFRGGELIGMMKVEEVEVRSAVGLMSAEDSPAVGDEVVSF